jgi:hypothetical protein
MTTVFSNEGLTWTRRREGEKKIKGDHHGSSMEQ